MNKILLGTLAGFTVSLSALAANGTVNNTQGTAASNNSHDQVCLYQKSSASSSCVKKISVTTPFVKIIQSQENPNWIKVGLQNKTGSVGWLNLSQYKQAQNAFYQPDIQTVFVHVDHNKNGKPTYTVVAYKNGKKVSDAQAKAFYKKIRREQETVFERTQAFENHFHQMLDRDFFGANQFFNNGNNERDFELPSLNNDENYNS